MRETLPLEFSEIFDHMLKLADSAFGVAYLALGAADGPVPTGLVVIVRRV